MMRNSTAYRPIAIASSCVIMATLIGSDSARVAHGRPPPGYTRSQPHPGPSSRFDVVPTQAAGAAQDCPDDQTTRYMALTPPARGGMELILRAPRVDVPPRIDGSRADDAWTGAPTIETSDRSSGRSITLSAVHTDTDLFISVRFDDDAPSTTHRTWHWNAEAANYLPLWNVQDVLSLKWSMSGYAIDLSLQNPQAHCADVWVWQAGRTNAAGYMDDGMHVIGSNRRSRHARVTSPVAPSMFLHEQFDTGQAAYAEIVPDQYVGACQPRYVPKPASGSRGDVRAVGRWDNGTWSIEIARALDTRHDDDITFEVGHTYLFAIACCRMRGAEPDPRLSQPLYHTGDAFDRLLLKVLPRD